MTSRHTSSGGASIFMETVTRLIRCAPVSAPPATSFGFPLANACSTAASNECRSHTQQLRGARSSAGSRSPCRLSISGSTSSGSSCAIAAATRAVTPVTFTRKPSEGATHEHQLGDAFDHLAVAEHVGSADVQRAPAVAAAPSPSRRASRSRRARRSAVCGSVRHGGKREHAACARPVGRAGETSATARRSRSTRAARPSRATADSRTCSTPRGWTGDARAVNARAGDPDRAGRRGRRCAARPHAAAAVAKFSAAVRSRSLKRQAGVARSLDALHRVDQVVGDLHAVERGGQAVTGDGVATHAAQPAS